LLRFFKLTLAYDGTDFHGWQVQPGRATVQGLLAEAIFVLTGERLLPQGSGRTDAGVHALAQVASFAAPTRIPIASLAAALNTKLPPEIRVLRAEEVGESFHARHSAQGKTYRYRIYREPVCSPFVRRYVMHHPYPLDEAAMAAAAAEVIGTHDFTSFAAVDPDRSTRLAEAGAEAGNVRTITRSEWRREGAELLYEVRGEGFLHHMVRNLVGTFLLVGKGRIAPGGVVEIIAARQRSAAGATAPASGLCLIEVEYPGEIEYPKAEL
jgi:tRNA pseudouridine38-40 synthase